MSYPETCSAVSVTRRNVGTVKRATNLLNRDMRKRVIYLLLLSLLIVACGDKSVAKSRGKAVSALSVKGTQLVNDKGETVCLRGVSYGWHQFWPRFYNDSSTAYFAKEWKADVVRAAMGVDIDKRSYVSNPQFGIDCVTSVVDAAIENNIYAIIDWHSHHLVLDKAKEFFALMATRYKGVPNVIYELYNEPVDDSWADLKAYYIELIKTIRAIEPGALILVGCPHWDQDIHLPAADPITEYDNIMYTMHFYAATHKQWLRDRTDEAIRKGLPVFVSECAGMEASGNGPIDYLEWKRWVDWMEQRDISWAAWSVSDKNETCSMLYPSAASTGYWREADIKPWGQMVRNELNPVKPTKETARLLENLKSVHKKGVMFGHHDDTNYGIGDGEGWEFEEGRSDVKSVCGDYPAVISFDLGELELGGDVTLDKVPFEKIRQEAVNQYERGGLVSLSWHVRNPKTGGTAWDVSDKTVVKSVLPGGECHEKFVGWLTKVAEFINSLKTKKGVKVPVLFRPWHEHTGSWFWWGQALCSADEYKALWIMTADVLARCGVDNVLYAYSTGIEPKTADDYMQRYPGNDIIDVVGFDNYQSDRERYMADMERLLNVAHDVAKSNDKVMAITETGYERIPDSEWWTGTLLPILEKHPTAYVLVWRNARERVAHHYAPYPSHASADDFVKFHKHSKTLFAKDVKLYK